MIFRFSICGLTVLFAIASTSFGQDETVAKLEWEQLKPTGAVATFEMPIKPRYVERSFAPIQDKPPVKVRLHLATVNDGSTTYIFGYHDLHEKPKDLKTVNAALDGAVRGAVGNVMGQLLEDAKGIAIGKYQGRQFGYQFVQNEKRFTVLSRVYLMNKRQYQLNVVMAADIFDEVLAAKFLNSFRYLEPDMDLPPRPRDTK